MTNTLQSNFASAVTSGGVVKGVSILTGGVEAIGHGIHTDATTLKQLLSVASKFKDGVKVRAGHVSGVDRIIGMVRNFRIDGNHVRGDLHLLRSHPAYSHTMEVIQTQPGNIGLSISFSGTPEEIGGKKFVRVDDLLAVDLVDFPAANPGGMFSSKAAPTFPGLVKAQMLAGKTAAQAIEFAAQQNPQLHRQWVNAGCQGLNLSSAFVGKTLGEIVAAKVSQGSSKTDALQFAAKHFPQTYAAWLTSGNTSTLN